MKELLAVCWEMPPLSGPRAVQVTRTLRELTLRGWRSRVVCFGARSNRYNQDYAISPEAGTDGKLRIVRVPSPEERFFFRALWRLCPPVKHLPDEKRVWIPGAVEAARRLLAETPADLLVSFAQPWSDHLIGLQLHRETGLPWVAHFSDPWVDNPYARRSPWQRRIGSRMEREVVAEASRVVFVNDRTADRVMAKYPSEWKRRARVVAHGFEATSTPPRVQSPGGPLRIVYTGRFYEDIRTPAPLLEAVAAVHRHTPLLGRLMIDFVGGSMAAYQLKATTLGLDGIVTFHGRRSPADAAAIASHAHALLIIDAPSDGPSMFLPSKLIDYLPLRRPILGLTPEEGASADLLKRLNYPIVHPTNVLAIAAALEALLLRYETKQLDVTERHDEVARAYDIRETTRALEGVFEEALTQ